MINKLFKPLESIIPGRVYPRGSSNVRAASCNRASSAPGPAELRALSALR